MGPVAKVRIQHDITTLVPYKELVIRRQKDKPSLAEASGSAICVNEEFSP